MAKWHIHHTELHSILLRVALGEAVAAVVLLPVMVPLTTVVAVPVTVADLEPVADGDPVGGGVRVAVPAMREKWAGEGNGAPFGQLGHPPNIPGTAPNVCGRGTFGGGRHRNPW